MRYVSRTLFAAVLSLSAVGAYGQDDQPSPPNPSNPPAQASPCPNIQIKSPTPKTIREGQPVTVMAQVSGGDKAVSPSILWSLSSGSIRDGQGTHKIEVDSNGAGAYRQIVAELWIGGYPPECTAQAAPYTFVVIPPAVKIDEFGELTPEKEAERIASASGAVSQGNDYIYVIAYSGRSSQRGYANLALRRMADQFSKAGVGPRRVGTLDGGFREQPAFEFWVVPEGSDVPRPTPTIDRKEIVYPKTTPARRVPARKP